MNYCCFAFILDVPTMLLLHSLCFCCTLLAIECANVTSTSQLQKSSIIPNFGIQNGTDNIVVLSDSGVSVANSRLPIKNEVNATNGTASSEEKHIRGVTNTSGFPDQLPSSVNISTTIVSQKNASSSTAESVPVAAPATNSTTKNSTISTPSLTTNSTTTSTTTTTTTSTTTENPKKPTITFSVEDQPDLLIKEHVIDSPNETPKALSSLGTATANASPIVPISFQPAEPISLSPSHTDGRAVIVPMVAIIFAIPLLVILGNFVTRHFRDYWSKRKYRRMDYLIEEMYQ